MFLLDREAFRITRRLVGWILQQKVTAHPLYKPLKLNNSFRANCSGMMPLSLLAAAIRIACS